MEGGNNVSGYSYVKVRNGSKNKLMTWYIYLNIKLTFSTLTILILSCLFQHRITKLAPREQSEEDLASLFENSLTVF